MSAEDNTKYDDTLFTLAKQSGGVQEFLTNVTSFLRRHTSFFTETPNNEWKDELLHIFRIEQAKLSKADGETIAPSTQTIKMDKLKPNEGNGCALPNYVWTQTLKEIELKIPLNCQHNVRARDVNIEMSKKSLKVALKGQPPIVNGELSKAIKHNESTWMLDDENNVNLTLEKVKKNVWWDRLMLTDPAISLADIEPEKVKLNDLNENQRKTVEEMLQSQQQSEMPKKIEHKKLLEFEKFKEMHPELDFSKCKFNDVLKPT